MVVGINEDDKSAIKTDFKAQVQGNQNNNQAFNPIGVTITTPIMKLNTPEIV